MPTAAEAARRPRDVGEYRVSEGMEPSLLEDEPHVTVTCFACHTVMHAGLDQVGQRVPCPECETLVAIPPPPVAGQKKSPLDGRVEEYPFCEEAEESGVGPRAAEQTYVPVTCRVCGTFMQLTEDQVGHQIVCPDCGVPMAVPPPVERAEKKSAPAADLGEYPVCEEADDRRAAAGWEDHRHFSVRCPLCQTLIQVTADQAGGETVCRDCETSFVVPRPPPPKRRRDLRAEVGEVYAVGDPIELPKYEPVIGTARFRPGHDLRPAGSRARLPRWPPVFGVFGFPAYRHSWPRWLGLSLGLIFPLLAGETAIRLAMAAGADWAASAPLFAAVMFAVVALILGAIWAALALVCCLDIVCETAYGHEQVQQWPDLLFVDWITDAFYGLSSLALAAAVGGGLAEGLQHFVGPKAWLAIPASLLLLFPVVLLSMLETGSPLNPLSAPVWRSLIGRWWAWGLFYVETTALVAAAGWVASLAVTGVPAGGSALAAPVLVATMMVYSRLLGRLAWYCGKAAQGRPHPAEPQPTDDEPNG